MFKIHNILSFCFTLAVLFAGTASTRAQLIIDTFDDGGQQAPPMSDVAASSAIGGRRSLDVDGEALGAVSDAEGLFSAVNGSPPGGVVTAEWNGGGTLGGVDLTAGGDFFAIDVVLIEGDGTEILNNLSLFVTDSSTTESSVSVSYGDLNILGPNLIPLSSLTGGADLTSVDIIRLETEVLTTSATITINSISVVPEPSTALLGGSALFGLIAIARRKQAA